MTPLESELAAVRDDLCRRWNALALPTIEE